MYADEKIGKSFLKNTKFLYTLPKRYYHTFNHVKKCFNYLCEFEFYSPFALSEIEFDQLAIAILFHDAVYDIPSGFHTNEICSANVAWYHLRSIGVKELFIDSICDLIKQTDHNLPWDGHYLSGILRDIDLQELGMSYRLFSKNNRNIRKEYAIYNDAEYIAGRRSFFSNLLDKKSIYVTGYFKENYELKARENIQRYLNGNY